MADTEKSVAAQQPEKVDTASESAAPAVDDVKMDDTPSASNEEAAEKADTTEDSKAAAADEKPSSDVDMNEAEAEKEAPKAAENTEEGASTTNDDSTKPEDESSEKKGDASKDQDQKAEAVSEAAAEGAASEANGATPSSSKQAARRKSTGTPAAKKLNKKASKARILHLDCTPGLPPWPVIIAEESMLPQTMLSTRPVTAARPDGSYREDFADGGKRAGDRTYPVMYLHTNEFSWTRNTDLAELDPDTVKDMISPKMRKDLQQAHILAAEQNNVEYYKGILSDYQQAKLADEEAKAAKAAAKKEKTEKKSKKSEATAVDDDEDVEMADAGDDDDVPVKKPKSSKKRKADEETATPQRTESVKKPKIKLTTSTPKAAANGAQSPKNGKESTTKASKPKSKPAKKDAEEKPAALKEPELTPEERHVRKEKEILFLRHRLQKGLLNRESEPKEDEMKSMSEFLTKLETFPDLEVSIIRATKINKVLKAILKLEGIPKEADFQFKTRSQSLLEKWNKILAGETGAAPANGVNGSAAKESANGVKEETSAEPSKETAKEEAKEESKDEVKETESKAKDDAEDKPSTEETAAGTEAAEVEPVA
ncbi:PWWP domain-containing protein [Apiospora arundinis]